MSYEPPHMPTKEEILARATEIFMEERAKLGLPAITPEESELREGSYWERARSELMSGIRSELERYLSELESEAEKVREELGIEKPPPVPERLTELENKLARLERRYKTTKERLKKAEEELRKIREKKPPVAPPPPKPPPAPPPPVPKGLTEEDKKRLEDLFKRVFIEAGVSYAGKLPAFRDMLRVLQEDLKEVPHPRALKLAEREVRDYAKSLIPYKPPPPPKPPVVRAVPIRVVVEEKRVPRIEKRMCIVCRKYFEIDVDLMRRVSESTEEIRGVGRVHWEPPILDFPEIFYHMCPDCRYARFGYRSIYDALAYLLAEARRSGYKRIKLTKDKLRAIGLTKEDLDEIQRLEARYRVP